MEPPSLEILAYPIVGAIVALRDGAVRQELDWTRLRGTSSLSPSGLLCPCELVTAPLHRRGWFASSAGTCQRTILLSLEQSSLTH